jgi:hypothetical protein
MTMIRDKILERMNELNLNPNQLYEILKSRKSNIPRMTIYDFLSGRTDARTEVASELMKELGLKITKDKRQKTKK